MTILKINLGLSLLPFQTLLDQEAQSLKIQRLQWETLSTLHLQITPINSETPLSPERIKWLKISNSRTSLISVRKRERSLQSWRELWMRNVKSCRMILTASKISLSLRLKSKILETTTKFPIKRSSKTSLKSYR